MFTISKHNKQAFVLLFATMTGAVLGLVASIINTRFLNPEDYGNVRYVQNVIYFISSILLFGYFLSGSRLLAISENEANSRNIRGALLIILSICSGMLIVSTFICSFIQGSEKIVSYLFIISTPVCFYPLFLNYINTVSQGDNHIGRISMARILPVLIYLPIAYYVYSKFGATSVRMMVLQWGLYSVVLLAIILSCKFSFKDLRDIFIRLNIENKQYGLQLYWGSLVMVSSNYIAGITIGWFSTNNIEVGFYTLALTLTAPLTMISGIIGTTYFKEFAKQNCIPRKMLLFTISISLLACVVFICLVKWLVVIFYTENYAPVGNYAIWLAVGFTVHGLGDMINRFLGSHGLGKPIRNSSIANGLFKIFGFIVLVYFFGVYGAVVTNIICSCIYTFLLALYYNRFSSQQ